MTWVVYVCVSVRCESGYPGVLGSAAVCGYGRSWIFLITRRVCVYQRQSVWRPRGPGKVFAESVAFQGFGFLRHIRLFHSLSLFWDANNTLAPADVWELKPLFGGELPPHWWPHTRAATHVRGAALPPGRGAAGVLSQFMRMYSIMSKKKYIHTHITIFTYLMQLCKILLLRASELINDNGARSAEIKRDLPCDDNAVIKRVSMYAFIRNYACQACVIML